MSRHCSSVKSVGYDPSGMTCRSSLRSLRTSRQHAESTIHQIKCLVIIIVLNLANLVTDMLSYCCCPTFPAVCSALLGVTLVAANVLILRELGCLEGPGVGLSYWYHTL